MKTMPVLFAAHGSPMNALEKNPFTEALTLAAQKIPKPRAVLCVSAHWETQGTSVLSSSHPQTIHDFYGFPKPLGEFQYPAPGAPALAKEVQKLLPNATLSEKWGFDHGTWSVLTHMYPDANVPVFQVSLDVNKSPAEHLALGKLLRPLREQGVLIVGSGNIVHNLGHIHWREPYSGFDWAKQFDLQIKNALHDRDETSLTQYEQKFGEPAQLSVPSPEHYLPLLYCFGASTQDDQLSFPFEGFAMGSLSMRDVLWTARP